jgi:methionyl-tRNA synthetase
MNKFYLTTPIYYVNDKPHIGSTYTTVIADALARAQRLRGRDVLFLTGTDENSQKSLEAANKAGETDLQAYLDKMASVWKTTWKELGITNDDFIRTTEPRHLKAVERFWKAVEKTGDIYKSKYSGQYCGGCEAFKTQQDLVEGKCPLHPNRELQTIEEENYFFRATAYRDALLKLLEEHPDFVQPTSRLNEIRNYIKDEMTDFSISRETKKLACGIQVPGDETQRIYVWFDALINYLTAAGYGTDDEALNHWWPADAHLVGKDIIKFHCALWPAMLMSAAKSDEALQGKDGAPLLPTNVFVNGFFTVDGVKISKSLGNAIDPLELKQEYAFDAIRYFLLREIAFGEDGDFSRVRLAERYTSDLGNTLGNLVNRVIGMSRKYFDGCVPSVEGKDVVAVATESKANWEATSLQTTWNEIEDNLLAARFDIMLDKIWNGDGWSLMKANKFVEETKPFQLAKTDMEATAAVLYVLLESCRQFAWMIEPVMPETAAKIIKQLGQDPEEERLKDIETLKKWGGLKPGSALPEPEILFPRIEK